MAGSMHKRIAVSLSAVAVVMLVAASGVLGLRGSILLDDIAQLAGGLAATTVCWWTSIHRTGPERQWRALLAVGMAGWTGGMAVWAFYRSVLNTPLPSTSIADIGFFLMPIFAVPALLAIIGRSPRRAVVGATQMWTISVLDGLVVVGSLFVLSWSTVLGAVVHSNQSGSLGFLVAIMYPITDLVLVIMVLMLAVVPRLLGRFRTQLVLLALGLIMLALSDSVYAYLIAVGAQEMPVLTDVGFVAGTTLIALAASAPPAQPMTGSERRLDHGSRLVERLTNDRTQLLLPYALMLTIGIVVGVQRLQNGKTDTVVFVLCVAVVLLSIARQVLTLIQNDTLLRQSSAAQTELSHRAHHDGLTGLLNRSSFDERLGTALLHGRAVLLLIDIDDFKAINDRFGHAAGDQLLIVLSDRLERCVGDNGVVDGIVARFGGDEFTALVHADLDTGCRAAMRIVDAFAGPHEIDGHVVRIGASVGVVELDGPVLNPVDELWAKHTADDLLRRADRAMYEAKRNGKAGAFVQDADGRLRLVYSRANVGEQFDWWIGATTARSSVDRGHSFGPLDGNYQGNRGTSPNIVAGEPEPARLIGPPTRT